MQSSGEIADDTYLDLLESAREGRLCKGSDNRSVADVCCIVLTIAASARLIRDLLLPLSSQFLQPTHLHILPQVILA